MLGHGSRRPAGGAQGIGQVADRAEVPQLVRVDDRGDAGDPVIGDLERLAARVYEATSAEERVAEDGALRKKDASSAQIDPGP